MKKNHLILWCLMLWATAGFTQPDLIQQFDKSRCTEYSQSYYVESSPVYYKVPISLTNPMVQYWNLFSKNEDGYQEIGKGKDSHFVGVKFPGTGEYYLVVDNGILPLLVEMNLKDQFLEVVTYSHCATHYVSSRK